MEQVNINRIGNYLYLYSIENNDENFNKLAQVITKKEYYIYRKTFHMIDNCRIVCKDSGSITIETDLVIHDKLLQDVTRTFFVKKLGVRKGGSCLHHWKSFFKFKIYSGL